MFLKMIDGSLQPYTLEQLRVDNPSVSFPQVIDKHVLDAFGLQFAITEPLKQILPPVSKDDVLAQRNKRLVDSDWTQLVDAQLEEDQKEEWRRYRQMLRDITSQPGFPENVVWPEQP